MTFLSLLPTHMFEGSKFMWFSVVETLALATGISVALLGGMPGSATPEYSPNDKNYAKIALIQRICALFCEFFAIRCPV